MNERDWAQLGLYLDRQAGLDPKAEVRWMTGALLGPSPSESPTAPSLNMQNV
jgi:hypothetical protein